MNKNSDPRANIPAYHIRVPPGEKAVPGDLAWNYVDNDWQPLSEVRTSERHNFFIRDITGCTQEEVKRLKHANAEADTPASYFRLNPGEIIQKDDLAYNFRTHTFEAHAYLEDMPVNATVHIIRNGLHKDKANAQKEATVSQTQTPKPNYGLW